MSQNIAPFLWFQKQAEEAMMFYTALFNNSRIVHISRYPNGPLEGPMAGMEGYVLTAEFELAGQRFLALDGNAPFHFTPAISFLVNCETETEAERLWEKLGDGGNILMPLQAYPPHQSKFGWLEDRYGLSWQINHGPRQQKITPSLLFCNAQAGKAEAAIRFYTALFPDSAIEHIEYFDSDQSGAASRVKVAFFRLWGREFMAMDSDLPHAFTFPIAISLYVDCASQAEVDRLWSSLSAVPQAEQCGWLQDRYGISWQIIPAILPQLLNDPDPEKSNRVMQAMLQMKKIDISALERAYHRS